MRVRRRLFPADVAILEHPDFIEVKHSTNWVEQSLDLSGIRRRKLGGRATATATGEDGESPTPTVQRDVDVEVDGRRYQVKLWVPDVGPLAATAGSPAASRPARPRPSAAAGAGGSPGADR